MRRILVAGAVAAALAAGPAAAETIKVKIAHGASSSHPFHKVCEMWAEEVETRTGGKVEVQVFGDRQLGDDRQVLEGAIAGTIDAAFPSSVMFPLVVKLASFDALQLPYLVNSYDDLAKMLTSEPAQKMLDSLDAVGLKGLGFGEAGQRHFLNRSGAVKQVTDFKGLKTRIVPVPLHKAMWEKVESNPVGIAYGEVYTSMQTNVIDAVEFNISSVESENMYEVAKHLSLTGHYFWPGVIVYNKAKFEALPEDVQKAMVEAGREVTPRHVMYTKEHESASAERLKAKGVTIYEFEDLDEIRTLMAPILDEWRSKDPIIGEYIDAANKL